ncbi:transmembrane protein 91 [Thecamonas trahens ATCC 50062]|uniref:2-oxoisovalerate dehydrogenase subunit alpha n=1 Tax=Thecamonas trahens ATCC 50062 TaxID=461836 RepID=A0A0L0DC30_THETB|nr:transmembrane protein 91 [Thecamonas trahens ATCC 50062]KNC49904.1 transmembrane protein 91 [Thecamonas trahens ATCC 50062]|eukprot:XP_013757385.1 transmembrane protein 91 [Thecamonas trahens ATCC 50062]
MFRLPALAPAVARAALRAVAAPGAAGARTAALSTGVPPAAGVGYPGAEEASFTTEFEFVDPETAFPMFQLMGPDGKFAVADDQRPAIAEDKELLLKMYKVMNTTQIMDTFMAKKQRQGAVSFIMTSYGEEATHVGSAAALTGDDVVYAQYRESGVLLWRGFSLDETMAQCFSTQADGGKGRQMPVHYGSKALNFQTISSPLATQIPQAAGAAYALKRSGKDAVAMTYFGDGAASEGDFHAALNFAATLECPALFFCRNNGYAISTPTKEQYRGDGIASRGPGYGIPTIRVDGNDVFAVYEAVARARTLAIEESRPVLIEAMSFRIGDHSSSDDSSRYRPDGERDKWAQVAPIPRLRSYIVERGWWSDDEDKELQDSLFADLMTAMRKALADKKPSLDEVFTDVYDELTPDLVAQEAELRVHLAKHGDKYDLGVFAPSTKA